VSAPLAFEAREDAPAPEALARRLSYVRAFAAAHPPGAVIDFSRPGDFGAGDAAIATRRENKGAF
jgi:hypothetical protein